jgi:ankyrin repeat protein
MSSQPTTSSNSIPIATWSSVQQPQWLTQHLTNTNHSLTFSQLPVNPSVELFQLVQSNRYSNPDDCLSAVKRCISAGAQLSYTSPYLNNNILHIVAAAGQVETLVYLFNNYYEKLNIYGVNDEGESFIYAAIKNKQVNTAAKIIQLGLENSLLIDLSQLLSLTPSFSCMNLLHLAASLGLDELLDLILIFGLIPVNSFDKGHRNALFHAVEGNHYSTAQLLLARNINFAQLDDNHNNVVHILARYGHMRLLQLFNEQQMFPKLISQENNDNETPLSIALNANHGDFLNELQHRLLKPRRRFLEQHRARLNSLIGFYVIFWLIAGVYHYHSRVRIYNQILLIRPLHDYLLHCCVLSAIICWFWTHYANPGRIVSSLTSNFSNQCNSAEVVPLLGISVNSSTTDRIAELFHNDYVTQLFNHLLLHPTQSSSQPYSAPSIRLCLTCRIIRPLRSKHCAHCNSCIALFDHYCPFVDQCIGCNNFTPFLIFIYTAAFTVWMYCYILYNSSQLWRWDALTLIFLPNLIGLGAFVSILAFQQTKLISKGYTTNEWANRHRVSYAYLNSKEYSQHNSLSNCYFFCCSSRQLKY